MNLKSLFTLALFLLVHAVQAQPLQRVVGRHFSLFDGTGMQGTDTAVVKYAAGNNNTGGGMELMYTGGLKYDSLDLYAYKTTGCELVLQQVLKYDDQWRIDTQMLFKIVRASYDHDEMYVTAYDAAGNTIQKSTYQKDELNNIWVIANRTTYTYGANGITEQMTEAPSVTFGPLFKAYHATYHYTGGNLSEAVHDKWDGSAWRPETRARYVYNIANGIDTILFKGWDNNTNDYVNYALETFAYHSAGQPSLHTEFTWENNIWRPFKEEKWQYYPNGKVKIDSLINIDMAGKRLPLYGVYHIYNAAGLEDTVYLTYWANGLLFTHTRAHYIYNADNQLTRRVALTWDHVNNVWGMGVGTSDEVYHFARVNGIHKLNSNIAGIHLYPNPAGSFVNVDVKVERQQPYTVTIHNSTGAVMRQWEEKGSNRRMISTTDLQAGNYIVTIRSGSDVQSAQFVIAR